jgi:MOSC domain
MIGSEPSFAACLASALGLEPNHLPMPDGEPNVFWRQWLAGRNLGLVPIEDPGSFSWPGFWIAAVDNGGAGRDVVLMFGVPSGPVLDPAGALAAGAAITEAAALAPFDLGLTPSAPYGPVPTQTGVVEALLLAPAAGAPLVRVPEAHAVSGSGLLGDRYATGDGTFSGTGRGYQLTLVEVETLDSLRLDGIDLSWEEARRNVVTRGIGLNALVGRRFGVGEVECVGARLAEPCSHLQALTPASVLRALVRRGGLRADIIRGGTMHVGDPVIPLGDDEDA